MHAITYGFLAGLIWLAIGYFVAMADTKAEECVPTWLFGTEVPC